VVTLIAMVSCLIVDDSPRFRAAAASVLRAQGVLVTGEAATGAEAVTMALELHPDVVLLDIDLGGESGFDVARKIIGIPIILVSARAYDAYGELVDTAPVAGFLHKSALSGDAVRQLIGRSGT
jgi:two-component system nitrate/nitrite response regulator NarL